MCSNVCVINTLKKHILEGFIQIRVLVEVLSQVNVIELTMIFIFYYPYSQVFILYFWFDGNSRACWKAAEFFI